MMFTSSKHCFCFLSQVNRSREKQSLLKQQNKIQKFKEIVTSHLSSEKLLGISKPTLPLSDHDTTAVLDFDTTAVLDVESGATSEQENPTVPEQKKHKGKKKKGKRKRKRTRRVKRHHVVPTTGTASKPAGDTIPAANALHKSRSIRRKSISDTIADMRKLFQEDIMNHQQNLAVEKHRARATLKSRLKTRGRGASLAVFADEAPNPDLITKKATLGPSLQKSDTEYINQQMSQLGLLKVQNEFLATLSPSKEIEEEERKKIERVVKSFTFGPQQEPVDSSSRSKLSIFFYLILDLIKGELKGSFDFLKDHRKRYVELCDTFLSFNYYHFFF